MKNTVIHMMTTDTIMKRILMTMTTIMSTIMKNIPMTMTTIMNTSMKSIRMTIMMITTTMCRTVTTMNTTRKNMQIMIMTCMFINIMSMMIWAAGPLVTGPLPISMNMNIILFTGITMTIIPNIPVSFIKYLKTRSVTGLLRL